ncbi:MAG: hypothetical protein ACYC9O_06285 [Candidatus Latescibacterota bacterium]
MGEFYARILENMRGIDYQGPAMFVIVFLALLAVFRRWSILLLALLTIVLGWGAQDLIILNMESQSRIVSMPLLIYGFGGFIILVLVLVSFYKS